jgi:hypothetical protein
MSEHTHSTSATRAFLSEDELSRAARATSHSLGGFHDDEHSDGGGSDTHVDEDAASTGARGKDGGRERHGGGNIGLEYNGAGGCSGGQDGQGSGQGSGVTVRAAASMRDGRDIAVHVPSSSAGAQQQHPQEQTEQTEQHEQQHYQRQHEHTHPEQQQQEQLKQRQQEEEQQQRQRGLERERTILWLKVIYFLSGVSSSTWGRFSAIYFVDEKKLNPFQVGLGWGIARVENTCEAPSVKHLVK